MRIPILRLLANAEMTISMSEGRRAVGSGIVSINDTPITDLNSDVEIQLGDTIKIGRRSQVVTLKMLDDA